MCEWVADGRKCHPFSFSLIYILCAHFVSAVDTCHFQLFNILSVASLYLNYFAHYDSRFLKAESMKLAFIDFEEKDRKPESLWSEEPARELELEIINVRLGSRRLLCFKICSV